MYTVSKNIYKISVLGFLLIYVMIFVLFFWNSKINRLYIFFPIVFSILFYNYMIFSERLNLNKKMKISLGVFVGYVCGIISIITVHIFGGNFFGNIINESKFWIGYFILPIYLLTPIAGGIVVILTMICKSKLSSRF